MAGLAAGVLAAGTAGLVAPASARADAQTIDGYGAVVTSSAVTVHGRGEFAGMTFTVNQTRDLTNQALSIDALHGVLANDHYAQGGDLYAVLRRLPSSGVLSLQADGSFVYTPNADFVGTDRFGVFRP